MESAHGRDLRKGRWSEPGQSYLVTTTTYRRRPLFADVVLGRIVVRSLRWSERHGHARTWAFVVMPDHLHWLFELGQAVTLSDVVGRMKSYSSRQVKRSTGLPGAIWQAGFHDHAVRVEEDLRGLAAYVVMNPVRAGLVRSIGEYPLWDACWL